MFGKLLAALVLVAMVAASTALACPPQVLMALSQPIVSQQAVSSQVVQQQEQVTQSTVMVPQTVESTVMVPQRVQSTVMVPQTTTTVTSVPVVVPQVQTFSTLSTVAVAPAVFATPVCAKRGLFGGLFGGRSKTVVKTRGYAF